MMWRRSHASGIPADECIFAAKRAGACIFLVALSLLAQDRQEVTSKDEKNPVAGQPIAIAAGKKLFLEGCSGCHGPNGEGGRGPNLVRAWFVRDATDRHLFEAIKNGVPGSDMPLSHLPEQSIWQIVAFLRSMNALAFDVEVPGDFQAGRNIFFGKGGCAKCHTISGQGGAPGPDLSNAGRENSVSQLREAILKPDARIAERNRAVRVITSDGREIAGVAKDNTNYSIVILDAEENLHLLMKTDLREVIFRKKSMMPGDYENRLSPGDVQDLLAFLARQSERSSNKE